MLSRRNVNTVPGPCGPSDDHVAGGRGDGDRCEGLHRVVPQDHLVGEDKTGDRGIEGRGDGRGNTAAGGNGGEIANAQTQAVDGAGDQRAEIDQWSVLADRGANAE